MWAERLQTGPQENRLHPQQQRVGVHVQLRVRRIRGRFPRWRSKAPDGNSCSERHQYKTSANAPERVANGVLLVNLSLLLHICVTQDVTRGMDTSLTLKLQKRVTELEQEKQSLRNELENREEQFQRARARVGRPHFTLVLPAICFLVPLMS